MQRCTETLASCGLMLAMLAGPAGADDSPPSAKKRRGELYVKVSTGLGLTEDSDVRIRQADPAAGNTNLTFSDVAWEDNSLSGPSARYTDVRFGYFFKSRPWLGVSVDFLHFKVFAEVHEPVRVRGVHQGVPIDTVQPMDAIVERYTVTNGVNLLPVSFLVRKRLKRSDRYPHGRVQPYTGFGAGPTLIYTRSTVNGWSRGGPYELGTVGVQALGGVQLHVGRSWDVFFEYKRTYTQVTGRIAGGSSRSDLHSNHYIVGGGVHF